MVIGKEDRRIIGIGARNSQEHDSNGRKGAMIVRIKEDQAHTALIRHLCTMIVVGNRGECWYREYDRSTTSAGG